ncbi:unnamed protein product [Pedinophyceae sp. YPF-701]|nr:unnamed protein product [Pedinophyceae sp. YPF-701]
MSSHVIALANQVRRGIPSLLRKVEVSKQNEVTLTASGPSAVLSILRYLRDDANLQFKQLMDVCGVDYPERENRFDVVYHLLSVHNAQRIRLKVDVDELTPVPSAVELFPAANWFEREAWDMYGVRFSNHPDLRRILTDYGFTGHPLRKDFPLSGYEEVRFDDTEKRVVYEPLELAQQYRAFSLTSPWDSRMDPKVETEQIGPDGKKIGEPEPAPAEPPK